jgi:hypothetical protein
MDELSEMPGQDSFLDVVANMVGIMILLVMVMGVRASSSVATARSGAATAGEETVSTQDIEKAQRLVQDAERDLVRLAMRARDVRGQALLREEERAMLAEFVAEGQQEINVLRSKMGREEQRDFDLRRQLAAAQSRLDELARDQVSLVSTEPEAEIVESLPTPLARTASGRELHLRLAAGHVAVVPLEQLQRQFEEQVERNIGRLQEQGFIEGSVGPVDGFRVSYKVHLDRIGVPTRAGIDRTLLVPNFECKYIPVAPMVGEPIDQALLPTSELRRRLKEYPAPSSTVTIWVYPDSFDDFRHLKKALFDLGYAAAGRPLPEGAPIGASNRGTKSAVQ